MFSPSTLTMFSISCSKYYFYKSLKPFSIPSPKIHSNFQTSKSCNNVSFNENGEDKQRNPPHNFMRHITLFKDHILYTPKRNKRVLKHATRETEAFQQTEQKTEIIPFSSQLSVPVTYLFYLPWTLYRSTFSCSPIRHFPGVLSYLQKHSACLPVSQLCMNKTPCMHGQLLGSLHE